jgi:hypothetical protein
MPALRLSILQIFPIFLICLAVSPPGIADEFPRGKWQVVEADFSDIGHCLMTEVLEYNLTLPRADGTDGIYTESFKRDGDAGTCPRVGSFRTTYAVKLDRGLKPKDGFIATMTFRDCEQNGSQVCGDNAPVSYKRLVLEAQRNGVIFDGIFLERVE